MASLRGLVGFFSPPPHGAGAARGSNDADASFRRFRETYPAYDATASLDKLRASEFGRLDRSGHVYLDYTGGGLYADSQLADHHSLLQDEVFGNPHSGNLTSRAMSRLVDRARERILRFFGTTPDEYQVVFTANATGALRLVGESYPFAAGGTLLMTADNHNSVNGLREFARTRGATTRYVALTPPELRVAPGLMEAALAEAVSGQPNLLAYPAQSNFSGVQHPLAWIDRAHEHGWDVLLDAAAFAPTNRLDLDRWRPDFVDLSFYKMFGYPTGIGALLVRHEAAARLRRPWYSGGTITFSTVAVGGHRFADGPARFEDGTVNYLGIPAIERGLDLLESVDLDAIHSRVMCLTGWLISELSALAHGNGQPVVRLYGPASTDRRGGSVQFNVLDPDGRLHDCYGVETLANDRRISLRAGCHCNPGAREAALGYTEVDLAPCFPVGDDLSDDQFAEIAESRSTGAVRASMGLASTFADVAACVAFVQSFVDRRIEDAE